MLWASEIQSIRDFDSETAVQQVQGDVARKLGRLRNDAAAVLRGRVGEVSCRVSLPSAQR